MALTQGNNPQSFFIDNFAVINHLRSLTDITPSEKLTALILLSHRNAKTLQCNPSIRKLVKETCATKRTVVKNLNALIKKGVIGKQQRLIAENYYTASHYYFLFDLSDAEIMLEESRPFQESTEADIFSEWRFGVGAIRHPPECSRTPREDAF